MTSIASTALSFSVKVGAIASTAALTSAIAMPATAASFSQVFSFGDSLVDTGNVFELTGLPPEPYFQGRFSNGLLWNEYVAEDLGIPLTSLAFGAATTGEQGQFIVGEDMTVPVPGLLSQVDSFLETSNSVDSEALYTIWVGANDYLAGEFSDPTIPVENIATAVTQLGEAGAENFALLNLPDLGDLPLTNTFPPEVSEALNTVSALHNQALAEAVNSLDAPDDISIELVDVDALVDMAFAGELEFENTTDSCIQTPACLSNPSVQSSFFFWDDIHPTTTVHRTVADLVLAEVSSEPIPEPTTVLGSLVGLLGLGSLKRLRSRQSRQIL